MDTPSKKLAIKIVDRLIAQKLLAPSDQAKILSRFAEGTLKSEDWRLAIDLAEEKSKKT